jgi:hypothetical protein
MAVRCTSMAARDMTFRLMTIDGIYSFDASVKVEFE